MYNFLTGLIWLLHFQNKGRGIRGIVVIETFPNSVWEVIVRGILPTSDKYEVTCNHRSSFVPVCGAHELLTSTRLEMEQLASRLYIRVLGRGLIVMGVSE